MKAIFGTTGIDVNNQIDFANNGEELLNMVKQAYSNDINYQIIFTDFSMPIMDGIKATFFVRKFLEEDMQISRKDQPVIIGVTGHFSKKYKIEGSEAGMDMVLSKPLYVDKLMQVLRKYKIKGKM